MLHLLLALACAEEVPVVVESSAAVVTVPEAPTGRSMRWGGVAVPLFGANSQDGFGLGLGAQVYGRPVTQLDGYRLKVSLALWGTVNGSYTADFLQVHYQGPVEWLGKAGYRGWSNHAFVGIGGDRVIRRQDRRELGNKVRGPFAFLSANKLLGPNISGFVQGSYTTYFVEPSRGGHLETRRPSGYRGATYADMSLGLEHNTVDRWPMPRQGHRFEMSLRAGGSAFHEGRFAPLLGGNAEFIGWKSLGKHLVIGSRLLMDKTIGERPFFTTDVLGGRWRDDVGSEQAFSGYGRTRSRGDGLMAGMIEIRPYLFRTPWKVIDFEVHASFFVEQGWLFNGRDPGPPLPTVGTGIHLLYQQAIQCRPFFAWGWRLDERTGQRHPQPQFGISFLDPL